MKKLTAIILITGITFTAYADFPPPSNFEFNYEYIMINQSGYCAGQWLNGPTYCSHFTWETPDTTLTHYALPEYYNIYYYDWWNYDTTILTSTVDTFFNMEIGIIGELWVTAVYSNPDGESKPSNIVTNSDLPISVKENQEPDEIFAFFDNRHKEIIINVSNISIVNIYDGQGNFVKTDKMTTGKIKFDDFPKGMYIIEIVFDNQKIKQLKIII